MSDIVIISIVIGVTIIAIVVLWQGLSVAKTEITGKQSTKYEKLAEEVNEFNQKSTVAQEKTVEVLEDIQIRLTAIEKLLREVQ